MFFVEIRVVTLTQRCGFGVVGNTVCLHQVNVGADHRVLDGATVAKFCNEWKLFIEKPELLMLHLR